MLSLLALMIPVFLAVGLELEKGVKKITAEEELRSEAGAFTADVREDIQRGRNFRLSPEGWLLFDLPSGETVRYKQHRRRVIRSVRPPGHTAFRGTTVLVHHVYFISFEPRRDGVGIELGMQNWHGDYDRKFFVGGRLTE
ncbi:hypothetical protein C8P63_101250 [Melghirimyces profundicolus]|uniref:Competence protein ComGF n=1 Tax=Melghirimyces profundicolus TaxID=1242148 RepID=A0A2T6C9R7_9BACL|nr:hypothetical protein C8P63_101250 [Melghirimyces profundicolus]